jgi:hypothetical protein
VLDLQWKEGSGQGQGWLASAGADRTVQVSVSLQTSELPNGRFGICRRAGTGGQSRYIHCMLLSH